MRYGGPDTDDVAAATGLGPGRIAEIHAAATYRVCARGTAGQPMLGGTDPRLHVDRRAVPRFDVPPLSVAIAGAPGHDLSARRAAGRVEPDRHVTRQR